MVLLYIYTHTHTHTHTHICKEAGHNEQKKNAEREKKPWHLKLYIKQNYSSKIKIWRVNFWYDIMRNSIDLIPSETDENN